MPSPPLPPRIALTDDVPPVRGWTSKRKAAVHSLAHEAGISQPDKLFPTGLALLCAGLMACLLVAFWKWEKTNEQLIEANRQIAIATKFGDGVLQDLALAREQTAKLDRERGNLVRMLGDAERLHANLRGELDSWRKKHREAVGNSEQALTEWMEYKKTLEKNLGETREQLVETSGALQKERTVAQQLVTVSEGERLSAERKANALAQQKRNAESQNQDLNQEAENLDAENARLNADVTRLKGVIGTLQTSNNILDARNAALVTDINVLRARIRKLEQGKDNDRDSSSRGN
ncbi:MAG: hypothetical protein JWO08_2308 [Verrucomicrobiaceae bacterium]|nr:hypothetical protein [Verrucomicrobiaceae bacterium]